MVLKCETLVSCHFSESLAFFHYASYFFLFSLTTAYFIVVYWDLNSHSSLRKIARLTLGSTPTCPQNCWDPRQLANLFSRNKVTSEGGWQKGQGRESLKFSKYKKYYIDIKYLKWMKNKFPFAIALNSGRKGFQHCVITYFYFSLFFKFSESR